LHAREPDMMSAVGNEITSAAIDRAPFPETYDHSGETHGAVDLAVLTSLEDAQIEGEPDIVVELMELYLEDASDKLAAMREELAEEGGGSVGRLAHSLKGSSANLGARRVAALCEELERMGEGGPSCCGSVLLNRLESELACVSRVFEAERRRRI
jgi:HPt (histidine-containing phosphotransfer) domain-containing protein